MIRYDIELELLDLLEKYYREWEKGGPRAHEYFNDLMFETRFWLTEGGSREL